jgi:hypothetical protein
MKTCLYPNELARWCSSLLVPLTTSAGASGSVFEGTTSISAFLPGCIEDAILQQGRHLRTHIEREALGYKEDWSL